MFYSHFNVLLHLATTVCPNCFYLNEDGIVSNGVHRIFQWGGGCEGKIEEPSTNSGVEFLARGSNPSPPARDC